jgi:hypothetical protein
MLLQTGEERCVLSESAEQQRNVRGVPDGLRVSSELRDPSTEQFLAGLRTASHPRVHCKSQDKKNGVFWDVTPCGPCKNRRFGGT